MDSFLVAENTVVSAKGDGGSLDLATAQGRVFLLQLAVTGTLEQQSLNVAIFTSADGTNWDAKPAASFPQVFYRGETPLLLDLTGRPEVKFLRAHWDVNRWGRGPETPSFEFHVRQREVPAEMVNETVRGTKVS